LSVEVFEDNYLILRNIKSTSVIFRVMNTIRRL